MQRCMTGTVNGGHVIVASPSEKRWWRDVAFGKLVMASSCARLHHFVAVRRRRARSFRGVQVSRFK